MTQAHANLRTLADAAEKDGQHIYTNPRDSNAWQANEAWHKAAAPEVVIELLNQIEQLEQGKCLHQIAEPAEYPHLPHSVADVVDFLDGRKADVDFSHPAPAGGTSLYTADQMRAYVATDRAQRAAAPQAAAHPDDAAVDALAALMKVKLAKQRAKGYGGWNDKTQCPQQRLSDMLRAHVDKGDPVDVANFCAFLVARGEGIAAAPQAVQAAVPATNHSGTPNSSTIIVPHGWKLVPDDATPEWVANLEALPDWREAVGECIKRFLAAAPAHPADGVPVPMPVAHPHHCTARTADGSCEECEGHAQAMAEWNADRTALAATHPTQQGMDAQTKAARSVLSERARQIAAEGYTPEQDDGYNPGVLALHGGLYACHAYDNLTKKRAPEGWQWDAKWWKSKDPRSNLVKAGALVLAEIERIDRACSAQAKQGEPQKGNYVWQLNVNNEPDGVFYDPLIHKHRFEAGEIYANREQAQAAAQAKQEGV